VHVVELEALHLSAVDERRIGRGQRLRRAPDRGRARGIEAAERRLQDAAPFERGAIDRAAERIQHEQLDALAHLVWNLLVAKPGHEAGDIAGVDVVAAGVFCHAKSGPQRDVKAASARLFRRNLDSVDSAVYSPHHPAFGEHATHPAGRNAAQLLAQTRGAVAARVMMARSSASSPPAHTAGDFATERLAAYAVALKFEDLPRTVVERAKHCLADSIACAVFGRQFPWSEMVLAEALASGEGGPCRLPGLAGKGLHVPQAAFALGAFAHAFEYDNMRKPGAGVHAGATVALPALAMAQAVK